LFRDSLGLDSETLERQVARSQASRMPLNHEKLCPVHRGSIAMSGSSYKAACGRVLGLDSETLESTILTEPALNNCTVSGLLS